MTVRRWCSITAVMAALAIGVVAAQAGAANAPADTPPLEPAAAVAGDGGASRKALAVYMPHLGCDATVVVVNRSRPRGPRPCRGATAGAGFVSPCTPAKRSPRALRELGTTCFVRAP